MLCRDLPLKICSGMTSPAIFTHSMLDNDDITCGNASVPGRSIERKVAVKLLQSKKSHHQGQSIGIGIRDIYQKYHDRPESWRSGTESKASWMDSPLRRDHSLSSDTKSSTLSVSTKWRYRTKQVDMHAARFVVGWNRPLLIASTDKEACTMLPA